MLAGLFGITLSVVPQTPAVVVAGISAVVASIYLMSQHARGIAGFSREKSPYAWLPIFAVLAICYFVARAWFSPVKDLGVEDLMLIIPAGIFYLLAGHALTGKQAIKVRLGLAWVVILLLVLHVISGLMQVYGGEGFSIVFQFLGATRVSEGHVTGMYGYYGSFANYAVMAGLLCLSLGVWGRFVFSVRSLFFILGLGSLFLAVISQSRSAVLSMFVGLGVLSALILLSLVHQNAQTKKWAIRVIGVTMLLTLVGAVAACFWVLKIRTTGDAEGGLNPIFDSVARLNFWPMAYDQWIDYPFFGAGARSFSYECFVYWNPNLSGAHANPEFVHNEYLQLLTDYGLVGFLIIITALVVHCHIGWSQARKLAVKIGGDGFKKGSNAMALTLAGASGMAAMGVHICLDFPTHLLANLLLFICSAIWVLPIVRTRLQGQAHVSAGWLRLDFKSLTVILCLFVLGVGAISIGGYQLWAGVPLIEQRMVKEDGAWKPYQVDRSAVIDMLEESLSRAPRWQRAKRLAIMYKIEADEAAQPQAKEKLYAMAEAACLASIKRNEYDLIPKINLAAIYTSQFRYAEADNAYAEISQRAKVREPRLMMHTHWASLRHRMAIMSAGKGESEAAEMHFQKASNLFEFSKDAGGTMRRNNWKQEYSLCLLSYAILLDEQSRFEDAHNIYVRAEEVQKESRLLAEAEFYYYRARHYYGHGLALWHDRQPEKACQMMSLAEQSMQRNRQYSSDKEWSSWGEQMKQIQKFIGFFKMTGIAK